MIAYHGPYNSRIGRAPFLGQDAVIQPVAPPPPAVPTPEPFGGPDTTVTPPPTGTTPVQAPPPVVPTPPAKPGWMVTIGGKTISGWTLVLSGAVLVGGIALVAYTKEDIDLLYAKKGSKKGKKK
jgi:hypothetical protein